MPMPKRRALTLILGLAVLFALLWPSLRPRPVPRYTVTDLGILPGDTVSGASGINNHGDIVGVSSRDGNCYPGQIFLYHRGKMNRVGQSEFLSADGGPAINDSGQINPKQRLSSFAVLSRFEKHHAILYSGSRKIDFVLPPGWTTATLRGMNRQGQIVGVCWRQKLGSRNDTAFVYDSKTKKITLLSLPPGFQGEGFAEDINNHEQIVGSAWQSASITQAILWNADQPVLLAGLPGMSDSQGLGINNRGEIVGTAWSEPNAAARFVNDHPLRWSLLAPIFRRQWEESAVIYKGGKVQDLNTLIPEDANWTLEQANGINDRGQIVGYGLHNGQERAFLLTPR